MRYKREWLDTANCLSAASGRIIAGYTEDYANTMTDERQKPLSRSAGDLEAMACEAGSGDAAPEQQIARQKAEIEALRSELRILAEHLFTAQEEERRRVARELHDDVGQRLSLLALLLNEIHGKSGEGDQEKLEEARNQLSALNTDVRQMSHRLHPSIVSDLGLSAALQALVREFAKRERMPATFTTHKLPEYSTPQAATAIYRIAQEALRNVAKHAGKTRVKVSLAGTGQAETGRWLELKVTDFGAGFDTKSGRPSWGLGMISMQERARLAGGSLQVQSALGQGTTVTAAIPLDSSL